MIKKSKAFVRNQVINYHFKMIRLYDTIIVLDKSETDRICLSEASKDYKFAINKSF
jgi:hypothetical protein